MKNNKTKVIINILKTVVILAIVVSILSVQNEPLIVKAALTAGIIACSMNDFFRIRFWQEKNRSAFNISIIISMVGAGLYYYWLHDAATSVYLVFPLAEIFIHSTALYSFVIFHFLIYLAANYPFRNLSIWIVVLTYSCVVVILFLFRNINAERKKEQCLNDKLKDANIKLMDYSEKIQQMAITEERTRIAQELHDSIGHGLIAIGMNLEFAENIIGTDPQKAEDVVRQAREQSKKCMDDLRKAVEALKNDSIIQTYSLQDLLDKLFCQFRPECVNFHLSFDNQVEQETLEVKDCVYKMVREAVTNGVWHGYADFFDIDISKKENRIMVSIKDNGTGCNNIVKSDGLLGIEKRISLLNGNVTYHSAHNDGFYIKAIIPSAVKDRGKAYD